MDHGDLEQIVNRTAVNHRIGTRQTPYTYVRFFGVNGRQSLNLGCRNQKSVFIADFVFKTGDPETNDLLAAAFIKEFGGKRLTKGPTVYVRLEPRFDQVPFLDGVIRSYWAMGFDPAAKQHISIP